MSNEAALPVDRPWTPAPWHATPYQSSIKPYSDTGHARHITIWIPSPTRDQDKPNADLIDLAPAMAHAVLAVADDVAGLDEPGLRHKMTDPEFFCYQLADKIRAIGAPDA